MTRTCTAWRAPTSEPAGRRGPAARGFTLLEVMVAVAVIGMAAAVVVTGTRTLLPQTRLRASAEELASTLERVRSYAVLKQEAMVFAYDLGEGRYEAWLPYERDEDGRPRGPGRTPVVDRVTLKEGVAFSRVRLPGGEHRDDGLVSLEISALGRMVPHEIVLLNPEYPETEVFTVRVNGISNRADVLSGDVTMIPREDADFR